MVEKIRIVFIILICLQAVYTDVKYGKIKNKLILLSLPVGIFFTLFEGNYYYIFISLVTFLILALVNNKLGGGDIKLISLLPLFLQDRFINFILVFFVVLIATEIIKRRKKGSVILAPGIFIATVFSLF